MHPKQQEKPVVLAQKCVRSSHRAADGLFLKKKKKRKGRELSAKQDSMLVLFQTFCSAFLVIM